MITNTLNVKEKELKAINFKEFLPIVYDDIEPHLMKELNNLREKLISMPDDSTEIEKMILFEECVYALNAIDEDENVESGIDTEEREGLCDTLYEMGDMVGLNSESEYIDEWKTW